MSHRLYVMISVAAEQAGMHPQTLRMYESRGLITPHRSGGNTRLYSTNDILKLRRIQELSAAGIGLAGIERILELEAAVISLQEHRQQRQAELVAAHTQIKQLRRQLLDAHAQLDVLAERRRRNSN